MKRPLMLAALGLFLCASVALAAHGQVYFKFKIQSVKELPELSKLMSIDNVKGDTVWAYSTDTKFESLKSRILDYEILPDPSSLIPARMAKSVADMKSWDSYPTYGTYVDMMEQYALDYPDLCVLDTIGSSVNGKLLLYVKISDNVNTEEDEPEVLFTSSMHGDEVTGYILTLRLIDYLLSNYGSDIQVTNMVDNMEIWINPLSNPDGTYRTDTTTINTATRYNANGVDLNRNFPDPDDGPHPDGHAWQVENIAQMNFAEAHDFIISANFHGGAEVVNYPWDTWARLHADDSWFVSVSRAYADTVHTYSGGGYMTDLDNGITNGYAWYTISGGRQDYMTYFRGGREVTIECSSDKNPPASQLPTFWNYNYRSMLHWLENALFGIRGIVTDSITGLPVSATVTVLGQNAADSTRVFTDPDVGDYHRMIEAGTYDLRFKAQGYVTKTVAGVSASDGLVTVQDVQLAPLTGDPVLSVLSNDLGFVDPGDTVDFYITLINDGGGNASNVTGELSNDDSYINVLQNTSGYPTLLGEGGTGASLVAYRFAVADNCPPQHETQFQLDIDIDGLPFTSDNFSTTIGLPREDFESGDFSSYPWQMDGTAAWTIVGGGVNGGADCAKSGDISDSQTSQMEVTLDINQSGNISFYYKVSSESGWDYLRFYIDYVQKDQWSGTVDWTEASYPVSAGQHTFRWSYEKDGSYSSGSDCGWVDFIVFPPTFQALSITTETLPDWTVDHEYSQQLTAEGGVGAWTWSDLNGDLVGSGLTLSSSGLLSGTPTSTGTVSFTAHVTDEGSGSADQPLSFTVNPHVAITTSSLPDGTVGEVYSQYLSVTGGTGATVWADKNDNLSAFGLSLSTDGHISGTPDSSGTVEVTAKVTDAVGDYAEKVFSFNVAAAYLCGDADGNEIVNISDAVALISFIFGGASAPDPLEAGDADCNQIVNISDAVYLIGYIFGGGAEPCAACSK
jgi:hypothetical protein